LLRRCAPRNDGKRRAGGALMVEDRRLGDALAYIILTIGVLIVAFPVWLTFVASTWDAATIINGNLPLYPGPYFFENYNRILFIGTSTTTREPVLNMLLNSFVMAMAIALGKIFISVLSAYAVVYYRFPFRMAAFWIIFVTLMLPVEVRIFPTFKIVSDLSMLDTYQGLAVPLIASATGTLLFRQFFMTIPDELLEASKIDGAGPFRFLIQFIYGWNQYLWPLLVTTKDSMQTIVIAIKKMVVTSDALTEWQLAMATAMLAMLPPVFVVIAMQRLFVKGLVETEK
jgi:sn-glycerol 3-phosphate transport system permease protein